MRLRTGSRPKGRLRVCQRLAITGIVITKSVVPFTLNAQAGSTRVQNPVESVALLMARGVDDITVLGKVASEQSASTWSLFAGEVLDTDVAIFPVQDEYLLAIESDTVVTRYRSAPELMSILEDAASGWWLRSDSLALLTILANAGPSQLNGEALSYYHGDWHSVVHTRMDRFQVLEQEESVEGTPLELVQSLEGVFGAARLSHARDVASGPQVFDVSTALLDRLSSSFRPFILDLGGGDSPLVGLRRESEDTFHGFAQGAATAGVVLIRTSEGWLGVVEEEERRWQLVPTDGGYIPMQVQGDTLVLEGVPRLPPLSRDTLGPQAAADGGDPIVDRTNRAAAERCDPDEPVDLLWVFSELATAYLRNEVGGLTPRRCPVRS